MNRKIIILTALFITMNLIAPKVMACIMPESITFNTGRLYPAFDWKILTYDIYVPDNTENITMTIHLRHDEIYPQCVGGYSINGGDTIHVVENEDVTFNLILQPGENVFVLKCYGDIKNEYTFTVKRYGCSTTEYLFNLASYKEIATGNTAISFTDPVTHGEVKVYLIDKCQLEYEVITGNSLDYLSLHFKETNGSSARDVNASVNASSIYKMNLDFGIIYGQVNPHNVTSTTHLNAYGHPSYTTIEYGSYFVITIRYNFPNGNQITEISVKYDRHSNDVVVSENNEILSRYDINHPGSISNMNVSNLTFIEKFCSGNNIELLETSTIRIYPNPTTGELRIENGALRIENIEIFDVHGRNVLSNHLIPTSSNHLINVSHLPNGLYLLKTGGKSVKFVKQ
jgi:hypothetical protein